MSPSELITHFKISLGTPYVLTDPHDTEPYFTDWTGKSHGQALCVLRPGTTQQVADVVRTCSTAGVPVFPQGGNTGVTGGSVPHPGGAGVVISVSRLNQIRTVDVPNNSMIVEAGCTLSQAQDAARDNDRFFPLSLSPEGTCQIGGNVATNAGGTAVLRYGNMRDLVLGLEVVLADGQIWNGLRSLRKDNTGYDLKSLFVGSEGTLGIVTAASLKLFPSPRSWSTAFVAVESVENACALLSLSQGTFDSHLITCELFSKSQLDNILTLIPGTRRPIEGDHPWYVMLEAGASEPDAPVAEAMEHVLSRALMEGLVVDAMIAQSDRDRADLWKLRHSVSEANRLAGINLTHDVAVPISRIPEFVARCEWETRHRFPAANTVVIAHLGDGNVHFCVIYPHGTPGNTSEDPFVLGRPVTAMVHDIAIDLGGSFGAEHGIGERYIPSLKKYKSAVELDMFRRLKQAFDPDGILNPGRVLPRQAARP